MSGYAQQQLSRASISAEEQKRAILLSVIPTALSLSLEYISTPDRNVARATLILLAIFTRTYK